MLKFLKNTSLLLILLFITSCKGPKALLQSMEVSPSKPMIVDYNVTGSLTKRLVLNIDNPGTYAGFSVFVGDELLMDDFNLPTPGTQVLTSTIKFEKRGPVKIRFQSFDQKLTIHSYRFEDLSALRLPQFKDITVQAGMDKVSSLKYGGPSVADIDNDGDYDFIANNHNAETTKLYWNNGDGTVTKHDKDLARWFKHDLHGTSLGDYDNDGDLDLVLAQGGGNGKNPSKANFYHNDKNVLVRYTGDVGIDRGGRGRGSKWMDLDLDGDLDLLLFNESSLDFAKPQQFFYENKNDGTFKYRPIKGIEDVEESRVLVTDFNNDHIDDLVFYGPLSLWKGNGDFTFTDVTSLVPASIRSLVQINAVTDIDIDNDGDLDFYLARGKLFEHGEEETPSLDFNPLTSELALKTRGYEGRDEFEFTAAGKIKLGDYYYLAQGPQLGKAYPIFMGKDKKPNNLKSGEDLEILPEMAAGWPEDISENGFYLGYLGSDRWRGVLVRDGNIFWQYRFSLSGLTSVSPKFIPQNRNLADILLRNDGDSFTDVSKEWNIPKGGNALGVTTGDFNNDSHQDLFIYRWGRIGARVSDYMLLNTGDNSFETTTMHGANDVGGPGNGDMGQAFDFDLDGRIDLLNGSEGGEWYLYANETEPSNNYVIVKVGYSPTSNIDPISAEVIVNTADGEYHKRVGSAGVVFSQSLLNMVHFGLGKSSEIKRIQIRWRNGETVEFKNKQVNAIYNTDKLDPESIVIKPLKIRKNTKAVVSLSFTPEQTERQVAWSSSNDQILSVDENGILTALGEPNQSATITATSMANGLTAQREIPIVEWSPMPITSIAIQSEKSILYTGQTTTLKTTISPELHDDAKLKWTSDHPEILSVDDTGTIHALTPGMTTIRAATSDKTVSSYLKFKVEPFIEPSIEIVDKSKYETEALIVGDDLKVTANYHAGSGNRVISADEGGVRFWLRHFKNKWIPQKDVVLTFEDALKTASGTATMTFSLEGATPTKDLPEGHFYQLRVTFTSSDGNMYADDVLPLKIVSKK